MRILPQNKLYLQHTHKKNPQKKGTKAVTRAVPFQNWYLNGKF